MYLFTTNIEISNVRSPWERKVIVIQSWVFEFDTKFINLMVPTYSKINN